MNSTRTSLKIEVSGILDDLKHQLGADIVTTLLYDPKTNAYRFPIGKGGIRDWDTFTDPRLRPCMDRITGRVITDRRPVYASDVSACRELNRPFAQREGIVSAACLPLVDTDKVYGVLFVDFRKRFEFSAQARGAIEVAAASVAEAVARHFPKGLPVATASGHIDGDTDIDEREQALDAVVSLCCDLTNKPVALWLLETGTPAGQGTAFSLLKHTGITKAYLGHARARLGDGSLPDRLMDQCEEVMVDPTADTELPNRDLILDAGWRQVYGIPIKVQGKVLGAMEVFDAEQRPLLHSETRVLRRLAHVAGLALENLEHVQRSRQVHEFVKRLDQTPHLQDIRELIVGTVCGLVGGNASRLVSREEKDDQFEVVAAYPVDGDPLDLPRGKDARGYTYEIGNTGEPILISNTVGDKRSKASFRDQGIYSLIGVRMQMGGGHVGVLYVYGVRKNQFTQHDLSLVLTLADQGALALRWASLLVGRIEAIEAATHRLLDLPSCLRKIGEDVATEFAFDGVNLQLIRKREKLIETVFGCGTSAMLLGLKHRLDVDEKYRDIQADIALADPPKADITRGWDERFDRWVYERLGHDRFERILVPLIVFRGPNGQVREDWPEVISWTEVYHEENDQRRLTSFVLDLPGSMQGRLEVIGTLGCAVLLPRRLETDEVERLLDKARRIAWELHRISQTHVLETIAKEARTILDADAATVHFARDRDTGEYAYEVGCGTLPKGFPQLFRPRSGTEGQGYEAIRIDGPVIRSGDTLKQKNWRVWQTGTRTLAAFPLVEGRDKGVLYLHFSRFRKISRVEQHWVGQFVERAREAIKVITYNTRLQDQVRQGKAIEGITGSLARDPDDPELLKAIAWTACNLSGADVVSVVEFDEDIGKCRGKPVTAGKLFNSRVGPVEFPYTTRGIEHLLHTRENLYVMDPITLEDYRVGKKGSGDFVDREGIQSVAFICLQVRGEMMGIMYVNYRKPHSFDLTERGLLESLADAAAITIRNRRVLKRQQQFLATMAHQLQAPLNAAVNDLDLMGYSIAHKFKPNLERAEALVDDALILSHGIVVSFGYDAGKTPALEILEIPVLDALRGLADRLSLSESRRDIGFDWDQVPRSLVLHTDPSIFTNLFYVLIHNALKYAESGSMVMFSVDLFAEGDRVRIAITSVGEPIRADERESIFQKFTQGKIVTETGRHHGGVGLGLWVARLLTDLIHGGLELEPVDADPRRSRFVVTLPIHLDLPQ